MDTLCQQVKNDYERLQSLTDCFFLEYDKAQKTNDRPALKRLKRELEIAYQELEVKLIVSINEARETLGEEMVLGPEEIFNAFGFEVKESEIPPIPYSREELEKAKELGEQLILRVSHDGEGKPMTLKRIHEIVDDRRDWDIDGSGLFYTYKGKNEDYYKNDPLKTEWKLVGGSYIPDVTSLKNKKVDYTKGAHDRSYIEQTKLLREYLKAVGLLTKEEEQECSDETLKKLSEQMGIDWDTCKVTNSVKNNANWKNVGYQLAMLQINLNHRRSATEIVFDWVLRFMKYKNSGFLKAYADWSRSFSEGEIVVVACKTDKGVVSFDKMKPQSRLTGVVSQR